MHFKCSSPETNLLSGTSCHLTKSKVKPHLTAPSPAPPWVPWLTPSAWAQNKAAARDWGASLGLKHTGGVKKPTHSLLLDSNQSRIPAQQHCSRNTEEIRNTACPCWFGCSGTTGLAKLCLTRGKTPATISNIYSSSFL